MNGFSEQWLADYQANRRGASLVAPVALVPAVISETRSISLALSVPPSVNDMFANLAGIGRVKTSKYRKWRQVAMQEAQIGMIGKTTIIGKFKATIHVAAPGDLDNRVKATLDLCETIGAIQNDIGLVELHVYRQPGKQGLWIVIEAVDPTAT